MTLDGDGILARWIDHRGLDDARQLVVEDGVKERGGGLPPRTEAFGHRPIGQNEPSLGAGRRALIEVFKGSIDQVGWSRVLVWSTAREMPRGWPSTMSFQMTIASPAPSMPA